MMDYHRAIAVAEEQHRDHVRAAEMDRLAHTCAPIERQSSWKQVVTGILKRWQTEPVVEKKTFVADEAPRLERHAL